jgi:hypothetical protein
MLLPVDTYFEAILACTADERLFETTIAPSNEYCDKLCSFFTLPAAAMFAWKSILGMTQAKHPMLYPVAIYSVKR